MGSFNWFNRQYNNKPAETDTSEAETEATAADSTEAKPADSTTAPSTEPPAVNQDYLTWAKAAYANIRKQQVESPPEAQTPAVHSPDAPAAPAEASVEAALVEAAPPAAPSPDPSAAAPAESLESPAAESLAESPIDTATDTTPDTTPDTTAETGAAELPQLDQLAEPTPEPTLDDDTATVPAPALPFWAQAEAERLARLERIQAEAQREAELAAEREAAAMRSEPLETESELVDAPPAIPDFVLDEAFLWSAEVLAAQGRRPDQVSMEEITWLKRLRQGLDKTRRSLVNQLRAIVGQGPLNQDAVTEIESLLLQADVGVEATDFIIESLQARLREETLPPQEAIAYLKELLRGMLDKPLGESHSLSFVPEKDKLNIWLITGVNGAGKTTTIGKLAHIAQKSGYRCLIAAADTFRAAAVQQIKVWGERSDVEVIANPGKNTDPAAVVFDAIAAAQSRHTELLLIDTAGRLQNKKNLMEELSKIRRIIDKKAPGAQVESLLVLDSTLGQNGLRQAEVFSEVAKLSGVVLTKLDGTAKGGIALAVVQQLELPIRFIGAGEGIEDLRPFSSYEFIEALLSG